MFRVNLASHQVPQRLAGHAKFIRQGWHDLYEIDGYAVRVLEALDWFERNDSKTWMPREVKQNIGPYQFEPEKLLKLKDASESAEAASKVIKPQKEWGVFSETLTITVRDEFLKARLKGKEQDAESFFEKVCQTFRRGLKLAPWLGPLYELGYCSMEGILFFAGSGHVYLFKDEGVGYLSSFGVDGTTGSVREAVRKLLSGESDGGTPLKYFHWEHPEVFEHMKERDPDLFHKLAVKILFRD